MPKLDVSPTILTFAQSNGDPTRDRAQNADGFRRLQDYAAWLEGQIKELRDLISAGGGTFNASGEIAYSALNRQSIDYPLAATRDPWEKLGENPSVVDWGVVMDGVRIEDAVVSVGSPNITSVSNKFIKTYHEGMAIRVDGAGAAGAALLTTILSVTSAGAAILATNALTATPAGTHAIWGTDNTAAFNQAVSNVRIRSEGTGTLSIPPGIAMVNGRIVWKSGVSISGPDCSTRYGQLSTWQYLQATIMAGPGFVGTDPVIDARGCDHTGFHHIEVVGNGRAQYNFLNATTIGLALGSADQPDTTDRFGCMIVGSSFINHRRGIHAKQIGSIKMLYNNVASCWKTGVKLENYAGNDGTYIGNNINSNYYTNNPVDLIGDDSGVGLDLGFGSAAQNWIGGKIEWNSIGVLIRAGAFGITLSKITFDANSRHAVQVHGQTDPEDIWTEPHTIEGCYFVGGSYITQVLSQDRDCHILVICPKSIGAPIPTVVNILDNNFKTARNGTDAYWPRNNGDPQYPKNATIRFISTGAGTNFSFPIVNITGNDFRHSSISTGTVNVAGTTVSLVSGDPFPDPASLNIEERLRAAEWIGKPIFLFFFDEFTIASITNPTTLVLTDAAAFAGVNYRVETNRIVVDRNLHRHTSFNITNNLGLIDERKNGQGDRRDSLVIYRSDDMTHDKSIASLRIADSGDLLARGLITGKNGLAVPSDQATGLYLGRRSSGDPTAFIAAYDIFGVSHPSILDIQVGGGGSVLGRFVSPGFKTDHLGANTNPNASYAIDAAGDVRVNGTIILPAFTPLRPMFVDGSGNVIPHKIKVFDANDIDVSGLTDLRPVIRSGTVLASGKVSGGDTNQFTLSGIPDNGILVALSDVISYLTLDALGSALWANAGFVASAKGALTHQHDTTVPQADSPTGTTSGHSHSVTSSNVPKTSGDPIW